MYMLRTRWRPYRVEHTGSLLTSEVKRRRARLVLGWGTAWEHLRVLPAFAKMNSQRGHRLNNTRALIRSPPPSLRALGVLPSIVHTIYIHK